MMKAIVIAQEHNRLGELDAILRKAGPEMEIESVIGGANQLGEEIGRKGVSVVVAETGEFDTRAQQAIEQALSARSNVSLILLSNDDSAHFLSWAMRTGVAEVVPAKSDALDLLRAVRRQIKRRRNSSAQISSFPSASVIAFQSAKGGSGATFLATSTASAIAARGNKVALIDLNLPMGEAALFVCDEQPTRSIADVAVDADRIDAALLHCAMIQVDENLWLLPAPDTPEAALEVDAGAVARLIEIATASFDYVVIDTGHVLDARTIGALDAADSVYLVVQLALPYLHGATQLKAVFDGLGYPPDKVRLVVNRYERGTDVTIRDVERALDLDVVTKVPNDFKTVTYAINHALPIFRHKKNHSISRAIFKLVDRLAPNAPRQHVLGAIGSLWHAAGSMYRHDAKHSDH